MAGGRLGQRAGLVVGVVCPEDDDGDQRRGGGRQLRRLGGVAAGEEGHHGSGTSACLRRVIMWSWAPRAQVTCPAARNAIHEPVRRRGGAIAMTTRRGGGERDDEPASPRCARRPFRPRLRVSERLAPLRSASDALLYPSMKIPRHAFREYDIRGTAERDLTRARSPARLARPRSRCYPRPRAAPTRAPPHRARPTRGGRPRRPPLERPAVRRALTDGRCDRAGADA